MTNEGSGMVKGPYDCIGGEDGVRKLVNRFYDLMDTLPEAKSIRALHPQDLTGSRDKLFKFLSGWLGGPQLYTEEFGDPRLRARHFPFPIGKAERDAWLLCMERALSEADMDNMMRMHLLQSLTKTADHMRNKAEDS